MMNFTANILYMLKDVAVFYYNAVWYIYHDNFRNIFCMKAPELTECGMQWYLMDFRDCRIGTKLLSKPMMAQYPDTYEHN